MQPAPLRAISSLDIDTYKRHIMRVYQRVKTELPLEKKQIKPYLRAFLLFVKLPSKWNKIIRKQPLLTKELLIRKMKDDVMMIINKHKLNCRLVHHPEDLPAGIAFYITSLLNSNQKYFSNSLKRLLTSTACIEGTVETATELVTNEKSRKRTAMDKYPRRKRW